MIKLLPILALVAFGLVQWQFSSWRLRKDLSARSSALDDPALEAVVRRLGRAVEIPHLKAQVFEQPVFNGLAAPDGQIYVTRGVIDQYRLDRLTADEVGSIIAHELGHVALGHSKRRRIEWTGQNAARWLLAMLLGRLVPFVGPWLAGAVIGMLAARLSRRDEYEADAYAAALMKRAGVDPQAQVSMLRKLQEMHQPPGGFAWLMSHPPIPDRIKAIEDHQGRWSDEGRETEPSGPA